MGTDRLADVIGIRIVVFHVCLTNACSLGSFLPFSKSLLPPLMSCVRFDQPLPLFTLGFLYPLVPLEASVGYVRTISTDVVQALP